MTENEIKAACEAGVAILSDPQIRIPAPLAPAANALWQMLAQIHGGKLVVSPRVDESA
jgi:hypothetical protein